MDIPTCVSTIQQWLIKDDKLPSSSVSSLLHKFHVEIVTQPPTLPLASSASSFSSSATATPVPLDTSPTIIPSSFIPSPSSIPSSLTPLSSSPSSTPTSDRPLLYILCEESKTTKHQVDNLGRTQQLSGRGYYESPPAMIHILTDRCTVPSSSSSSSSSSTNDLENLLQHELIHALDHRLYGMDITTCGGLSCSEIRAAKAAECKNVWPAWLRKRCIKSIASTSTSMVFPDYGSQCVEATFSLCSEAETETNLKLALETLITKANNSHA